MVQLLKWLRQRQGELITIAGVVGTPLVGLIAGIVTVKCLSPEETGTLNLAALWPAYLGFLHFGALTGMARQLPLAIGRGDVAHADRILDVTASIVWRTSVIGAVVCLVLAFELGWMKGDSLLGAALAVGSIVVLCNNTIQQVDTALRSYGRFQRFGINQIASNLINLVATVLIPFFGASGAVGRLASVGIASVLVRSGTGYLRRQRNLDWGEIRQLVSVGFPLLISGMLFTFLMMADRSIVAVMLTREEVGYFSLSAIVVNSMQFVPQSLSLIVFPKMARLYGATKDAAALRPLLLKTLWLNLATLVPLSTISYFLLPMIICKYFPAYTQGIRAAQIACGTCVFWVYLGMGSVFGVMNRMRAYLGVLAFSIVLVWLGGYLSIKAGCGIEGAALARMVATSVVCVFTIGYSIHMTSRTMQGGEKINNA